MTNTKTTEADRKAAGIIAASYAVIFRELGHEYKLTEPTITRIAEIIAENRQ